MFWKFLSKFKAPKFDYTESGIGRKIISVYGSDLMVSCVTGMCGIEQIEKLNEFCGHMAAVAREGDCFGIAISCFSKHDELFDEHLPIPIDVMPDEAFTIFVELLNKNIIVGISESARNYLTRSRDGVEKKAKENNAHALWLMGAWYAFDDIERKGHDLCMKERLYWYEKSAFEGYLPSIIATAGLYDSENGSLPCDLKKAAFWYRQGALAGDSLCAYNLGVMYSQGDFVAKNNDIASEWLSFSYNKCNDPLFASHVKKFAKQFGVQLKNTTSINNDPELCSYTSEFQDAYHDNYSNNSGEKLYEWVNKNKNREKFEPHEIDGWNDIKKIRLSSNDLDELSSDILLLTGVVDLKLYHNFTVIPDFVFELIELKSLDLGNNSIVDLSANIGRLNQLKILDLGCNQISSLPVEIGRLTNLEQLILYKNNLTSLPREISNMTCLKRISVWDNDLSFLPEEIINLNNLELIELERNKFTDENVKMLMHKFENTKCKASFGYQQGNISDPIRVKATVKGGTPEDSFLAMFLNTQDGDVVSNIFYWPCSDVSKDTDEDADDFLKNFMANLKFNEMSVTDGLTAINSNNNIVPIYIELNLEIPSTENDVLQWGKLTYIQICNEYNLKPNSRLRIASLGSSGKKKIISLWESIK
ncbi:MAG: leucine-rich repeat domain-containing protein [Pseudomonadota bacterium]|nr:leucine-rich repeat domain-containing protein [Pseudomonadota bacterium]